jgi:hypothetical protein
MIGNFYKPTHEKWQSILNGLRVLIITIAGSATYQNDMKVAYWSALLGGLIELMIEILAPTGKGQKKSELWLKISLGLRTIIASVSGLEYVQGNTDLAFYYLVAGAVIQFVIQTLSPKKTTSIISIFIFLFLFASGCRTRITPEVFNSSLDSSWIENQKVPLKLEPAKAGASVNTDSLLKAQKDSNGKITPSAPVIVNDPKMRAQLKYWMDQYGKLMLECEAKAIDTVVDVPVKRRLVILQKTIVKPPVVIEVTPKWIQVILLVSALANVIFIIIIKLK